MIEKSPESSPTTKPRQGGGFSQPHSPAGPSPVPPDPEPHGSCAPGSSSGVYLVPDKDKDEDEDKQHGLQSSGGRKEGDREEQRDGRMLVMENGYQHCSSSNSASAFAPPQLRAQTHKQDRYRPTLFASCSCLSR